MGASICWAVAEADTQFANFDSSAPKKQLPIFKIPGFPLQFLLLYDKQIPDQYSMFGVDVVDPNKRQVMLRPFATKTLEGKAIPSYVKAVHCRRLQADIGIAKIPINDVVLLAPKIEEPDPFCVFQITIKSSKLQKLCSSRKAKQRNGRRSLAVTH